MRTVWGYLGPVLLALGAWLAAPTPHPTFSSTVVLGLVATSAILGLVTLHLGSQVGVGVAMAAAIAATLPPIVPMGWPGALLIVVGSALSLEGAVSRGSGLPMAPLRSWALPAGLTLTAALVALLALTTQVGRDSIDISQGVGLAVSAPLLLGAGWAVLRALRSSDEESSSSLVPAIVAIMLLVGGAFVLSAPTTKAEREFDPGPCVDGQGARFWSREAFGGCTARLHLLVDENTSQVVNNQSWQLTQDERLLIRPGFEKGLFQNFTFESATLEVPATTGTETSCPHKVLELARNTEGFNEETRVGSLPETTDPLTASRTQTECAAGSPLRYNVTEHFQAWADGEPQTGWTLRLAQGQTFQGRGSPSEMAASFDVHEPEIRNVTSSPASVETEDGAEKLMAPVGERLEFNLSINDSRGGVRNVELLLGDRVILNETLAANDGGDLNETVGYTVDPARANGTLTARVVDWDRWADDVRVAELDPDREPPQAQPTEDTTLERTDTGWRVPDPVPRGEQVEIGLDVQDDSCESVPDCVRLTVRNQTDAVVAERSGSGTLSFPLSTDRPGDHVFKLDLSDAADRLNASTLSYRVSEPDAPILEDVSVTDGLGRSDQQEAGLPLEVDLTVEDVSPPIDLRIHAGSDLLVNRTFETTSVDRVLRPVVEEPGRKNLRITAVDRWGNEETILRAVDIHQARAPIIELPDRAFVPTQPTLPVHIEDASVTPENVSVEVLRSGAALPIDVATEVTEEGVDLSVQLPDLLHGSDLRMVVHATDRLGLFTPETADFEADVLGPRLQVEPSIGARTTEAVWTLQNATLDVEAGDPDSGLAGVRLLEPISRELAANESVPVSEVGTRQVTIEAVDEVGNRANWSGQVQIDDEAPSLQVAIDGHHVVANITEDESGLDRVQLTVDGEPLGIPRVPGTHRVEIPGVKRGDQVEVDLLAEDRVQHVTNVTRELEVGDAPPEVRLGTLAGNHLRTFADDPDGDEVTLSARAVHRVNGSSVSLRPTEDGTFVLPNWRGDVRLIVDAEAHNATTTNARSFTLGEGPFIDVELPEQAEPGTTVTVDVSWVRAYDSIQIVVTHEGERVALANVTESDAGQGQASFTLPEEGTYSLRLSAQHESGTVETASLGQMEAQSGPSGVFLLIGGLLLVALVGLVLLERYRDEEDEAPADEAPPSNPP